MKINFVLPFAGLAGGIRVLAIYAERLKQRGHMISAVSVPHEIPLRRKIKSLALGRGWPGKRREPSHFDGVDIEHRILDRVRPVTDADLHDADVVVATYYPTAPPVARLSPEKGAKAFFIQNYEAEDGKHDAVLDAAWRAPLHKIVISKWLVQVAHERFGDDTVSHVPNSVDVTQFNAGPRGKQRVPTVGLLYSTSWMKGCRTSLRALRKVSASFPSLRVIAFGAEPVGLDLRLPPGAEFHFRPPQEQLRSLYAECDLWICGSNREGFHLPPLEAMACRCPVVSTRVGGPEDTVVEGENGYLVDIGDADGLAEKALKVLRLPESEWRRMSDAAYATATHYSWDDATTLFEQALHRAVERSKGGKRLARA